MRDRGDGGTAGGGGGGGVDAVASSSHPAHATLQESRAIRIFGLLFDVLCGLV
jgi:hypothetical protein